MTALLYIVGFIIGIAVFFYLYSAYQTGKEGVKKVIRPVKIPPVPVDTKASGPPVAGLHNRVPGSRTCPLCGSTLTKTEPLYGIKVSDGPHEKILIYGCPYCYKEERNKAP